RDHELAEPAEIATRPIAEDALAASPIVDRVEQEHPAAPDESPEIRTVVFAEQRRDEDEQEPARGGESEQEVGNRGSGIANRGTAFPVFAPAPSLEQLRRL